MIKDTMDFKTILDGLNALPIFKMSLGSKELFHSKHDKI